jgi:hypothetical protein
MGQCARWLAAALTTSVVAVASPSLAGSWKYELEQPRGKTVLRYIEDGKAMFYMGCAHAFELHVKYPGAAKTEGKSSVTIARGNSSMTFEGEFEPAEEGSATTFEQWDLGYGHQDPNLYRKKWKAVRDRLFDILDSSRPLIISAGTDRYKLPPVDAPNWRKPFEECG